jgi:hypothetical protein
MVGITAFPARITASTSVLAAVAQVVLRQPFTDSIDGRRVASGRMGKWG